ncbi:MAG: lipoate--protein ligase family protein, partial [Chloroherpetonaceae bacterium]
MKTIYFLETVVQRGTFHMQLDEWLAEGFEQIGVSEDAMILRLYQWSPPAISIGYHQREKEFDIERLNADGIDLCRRPTGGRAVFHIEDLTYSVVMKATKSNAEHYADIHHALQHALQQVGLQAEFQKQQTDFRARYEKPESLSCFTASARYELEVNEKKIVGSAQRRFADTLLQHGSLMCSAKHKQLVKYLLLSDSAKQQMQKDLDEKTTSVEESLGSCPNFEALKRAVLWGFEQQFHAPIKLLDLSTLPIADALTTDS